MTQDCYNIDKLSELHYTIIMIRKVRKQGFFEKKRFTYYFMYCCSRYHHISAAYKKHYHLSKKAGFNTSSTIQYFCDITENRRTNSTARGKFRLSHSRPDTRASQVLSACDHRGCGLFTLPLDKRSGYAHYPDKWCKKCGAYIP